MNYHLKVENNLQSEEITRIFSNVFRKNFDTPGFAVITFTGKMDSKSLRNQMVYMKKALSGKCEKAFGYELDYYWLGRFNQQTTTKYHRDNAPEDSFLMLGYEPSSIESKLYLADYSKLVQEKEIPINQYYELYNPIFTEGESLLKPYINEVGEFDKNAHKIVLINNSDLSSQITFGVLHKAEIIRKDLTKDRVINSMMLYLKSGEVPNKKTIYTETEFVETDLISR